jgi:hypothetical protein
MKKIICDTNIWYKLGDGSIEKPKGVKLVATWINIIEICFSHINIKASLNTNSVYKAAKAIKEYSDHIIKEDFLMYSTNKLKPIDKKDTYPIEQILDSFIDNKSIIEDDNNYIENKSHYEYFMKYKDDFANNLNNQKKKLRKEIIGDNKSKSEFKKSTDEGIKKHAHYLITDIDNYIRENFDLKTSFNRANKDKDYHDTIKNTINLFELYVTVKNEFIKKWLLQSNMKIESNDIFDLANLLYVNSNEYYWTLENRWLTLIKESGMGKFIFKQ